MDIRILLADDHKIVREGLRSLIAEQQGMTVVAEAEDGGTAIEAALELMPEIVIMDISMPGLNGIEATRRILSSKPSVKVLAFSMHLEKHRVLEMLNAGASGYLLKDCAFEEVVNAIRTVASNHTYLSPQVADLLIKDCIHKFPANEIAPILTSKEREALRLLAEGKKTQEIAAALHVSVKTAEAYRCRIMEKLDIHSIAELTKYAIREGLTSL